MLGIDRHDINSDSDQGDALPQGLAIDIDRRRHMRHASVKAG
jgi:hypothetical protein